MDGFNPNFKINYEPEIKIKVNFTSFSTNNTKCRIESYFIDELPEYLDNIYTSVGDKVQSFELKLDSIKLG